MQHLLETPLPLGRSLLPGVPFRLDPRGGSVVAGGAAAIVWDTVSLDLNRPSMKNGSGDAAGLGGYFACTNIESSRSQYGTVMDARC